MSVTSQIKERIAELRSNLQLDVKVYADQKGVAMLYEVFSRDYSPANNDDYHKYRKRIASTTIAIERLQRVLDAMGADEKDFLRFNLLPLVVNPQFTWLDEPLKIVDRAVARIREELSDYGVRRRLQEHGGLTITKYDLQKSFFAIVVRETAEADRYSVNVYDARSGKPPVGGFEFAFHRLWEGAPEYDMSVEGEQDNG